MSENLFAEFPKPEKELWKQLIEKETKGMPYEKLVYHSPDGIAIEPYYTDLAEKKTVGLSSSSGNDWFITEEMQPSSSEIEVSKLVHHGFEHGAEATIFNFQDIKSFDWNKVFNSIQSEFAPVVITNLIADNDIAEAIELLLKLESPLTGYIDLLSQLLEKPSSALIEGIKEIQSKHPNLGLAVLDTTEIHDNGGNNAQQLAFAIEKLSQLQEFSTSNSLTIVKCLIQVPIGSNYLMELAKIRALRYLVDYWSSFYEIQCPSVQIMATSSNWYHTAYDANNNLLRHTTQAMSAIIGGVEFLWLKRHDYASTNQPFITRMARNIQLILKNEAGLGIIHDPAKGSYLIERMTYALTQKAWEQFINWNILDSKDRINQIVKDVEQIRTKQQLEFQKRKVVQVGVNQFPNNKEVLNNMPLFPRLSGELEALRYKVDTWTKKNNRKPSVFLFVYGDLTMRRARASFIANFFGCVGFEIHDHNGYSSIDEGMDACKTGNYDISVLCSNDETYAELTSAIKRCAADHTILVAGFPEAMVETLRSHGVAGFIHVKSNLIAELEHWVNKICK